MSCLIRNVDDQCTNTQSNEIKPRTDLSPAVCLTLLGYPPDRIMNFAHCSLKKSRSPPLGRKQPALANVEPMTEVGFHWKPGGQSRSWVQSHCMTSCNCKLQRFWGFSESHWTWAPPVGPNSLWFVGVANLQRAESQEGLATSTGLDLWLLSPQKFCSATWDPEVDQICEILMRVAV